MPDTPGKKQEHSAEGAKPRRTRKHNTPKKYPNKGTGECKNPRKLCPECAKQGISRNLNKVNQRYVVEGKLIILKPLAFCKCGYVEHNWEELAKVPD